MRIEDIPEAVIRRLPVYYRNVCSMEAEGLEKTTPAEAAEEIMKKAVEGNVGGIWNFAPVDLRSCDKTKVRNVHLGDSLLTLSLLTSGSIGS